MATENETPITIRVYLIVSSLEGQLTFFISNLTSLRKVVILFGIDGMVFKKPFPGFRVYASQKILKCQGSLLSWRGSG